MNSYDFRGTVNWNHTFDNSHIVNLFGGMEVSDISRNKNFFNGWGMQYTKGEIPFYTYQFFKKSIESGTDYYTLSNTFSRTAAFFANSTYSYKGRYVINGTYRYEGTNRLGKSRSARWLPTWNVSGAWNMHEENFFENLRPTLSHLTLKASYSLTGDPGPTNVSNGKTGNVETHLFQVSATGDLNTAITEWTAFDDDVYNAFVPYYPMLTTDTADVYKVSVHKVTRSDEQPTEGVWYQDAKGRYYTYPDDWTDSFYGVRDALSNLLTYGSNGNQVTAKDRAAAKASYAALQQEIMADYADMKAAVAAADTLEAKQAAATNASNAMSQKVYNTTLKMYNKLQAKTAARAWVSSLLH